MQFNLMEDRLASNNGILRKNLAEPSDGDGAVCQRAELRAQDIFDFQGQLFHRGGSQAGTVCRIPNTRCLNEAVETITAIMRKAGACRHDTEFIISRSAISAWNPRRRAELCPDHICSGAGVRWWSARNTRNDLFEMTVEIGSRVSTPGIPAGFLDTAVKVRDAAH